MVMVQKSKLRYRIILFIIKKRCSTVVVEHRCGSGYGSRTRVPGVRGRYPRPLDEPTVFALSLRKSGAEGGGFEPPVR